MTTSDKSLTARVAALIFALGALPPALAQSDEFVEEAAVAECYRQAFRLDFFRGRETARPPASEATYAVTRFSLEGRGTNYAVEIPVIGNGEVYRVRCVRRNEVSGATPVVLNGLEEWDGRALPEWERRKFSPPLTMPSKFAALFACADSWRRWTPSWTQWVANAADAAAVENFLNALPDRESYFSTSGFGRAQADADGFSMRKIELPAGDLTEPGAWDHAISGALVAFPSKPSAAQITIAGDFELGAYYIFALPVAFGGREMWFECRWWREPGVISAGVYAKGDDGEKRYPSF